LDRELVAPVLAQLLQIAAGVGGGHAGDGGAHRVLRSISRAAASRAAAILSTCSLERGPEARRSFRAIFTLPMARRMRGAKSPWPPAWSMRAKMASTRPLFLSR